MKTTWTFIAAACLITLSPIGCGKGSEKPIDGIGDFKFGKSVLSDWGYRCNAPENGTTFCQANPRAKTHFLDLGGQNAQANALFDGTTDDAPLIEIELFVEKCQPARLRLWLKQKFGNASSEREDKAFWEKEIIFISALVPPSAKECSVVFLDKKRKDRVAELMK